MYMSCGPDHVHEEDSRVACRASRPSETPQRRASNSMELDPTTIRVDTARPLVGTAVKKAPWGPKVQWHHAYDVPKVPRRLPQDYVPEAVAELSAAAHQPAMQHHMMPNRDGVPPVGAGMPGQIMSGGFHPGKGGPPPGFMPPYMGGEGGGGGWGKGMGGGWGKGGGKGGPGFPGGPMMGMDAGWGGGKGGSKGGGKGGGRRGSGGGRGGGGMMGGGPMMTGGGMPGGDWQGGPPCMQQGPPS